MSYDSGPDTQEHIRKVERMIDIILCELMKRKRVHDLSKLEPPEKPVFDEMTPLLKDSTYGSVEYNGFLERMKPALQHHYESNSHHPEHYPNGMYGFDLCDLVEMFCDWCAATMRHNDGDIGKSITKNMDRFGYDEMMASIFANTAIRFQMGNHPHWVTRPIESPFNNAYHEACKRGDKQKSAVNAANEPCSEAE